jgi:hypothetical protein
MSWALDSGFGFGACAVAAQLSGNVVEVLEREAMDTEKALDRSLALGAAAAKGRLQAIVNSARQTAYGGGNISHFAEPIMQVWRDLSAQLNANPHLWADTHAFSAGFNLGGAYMRCERNLRHPSTPINLKEAAAALTRLRVQLPSFTFDFTSRIQHIEAMYPTENLATLADSISALNGDVGANLQLT